MALELSDIVGNRITDDRAGSLTLRSDHMNYSRAVLNSHWHQARQAEPKDYDINRDPVRTMTFATYNRIGNVTDGTLPHTTYQDQANQCHLKPMFENRDTHKAMVQLETLSSANAGIGRDTGIPRGSFGSVLPYHNKEHNKFHLDTTYNADFIPPYPLQESQKETEANQTCEMEDNSVAYKKMKSQFTDTGNHRREGRNTWQDESGIYANSHYKAQVFPKTKTTMPPNPMAN